MSDTTPALEPYHYPKQYGALLENTRAHEMQILHEDGVYRHLRFKAPDTMMWHFDLITWPGSLAIRGDIGSGFIFTRTVDMLRFFDQGQGPGWINASYWAEKLERGSRSAREFSPSRFADWLRERDAGEALEGAGEVENVNEAIEYLDRHQIEWDFESPESWEDYEYHFLLALHAILWGAKTYHAAKRGD
ncbi:hypothetical protein MN032_10835 [Agromyces atrinae]|uniref:hypothetical protein n=1 Tax=Agromyces atrinae TaxID=592376 RepID=UPI001F576A5F|nr:hypothetical protein [Agromyces atrinae]MCI2958192.1 hypothetical protein [Agromyces atrinae]